LTREETARPISPDIWQRSKRRVEIFTHAAVGVINEYCEGIPRQVNKGGNRLLDGGSRANQKLIDDHLVRVVIESEFEGVINAGAELQTPLRSAKSSYILGHQS